VTQYRVHSLSIPPPPFPLSLLLLPVLFSPLSKQSDLLLSSTAGKGTVRGPHYGDHLDEALTLGCCGLGSHIPSPLCTLGTTWQSPAEATLRIQWINTWPAVQQVRGALTAVVTAGH
jgi:hypothetical protein